GRKVGNTRDQSRELGMLRHTFVHAGQRVALVVHDDEQVQRVERLDLHGIHAFTMPGILRRSGRRGELIDGLLDLADVPSLSPSTSSDLISSQTALALRRNALSSGTSP